MASNIVVKVEEVCNTISGRNAKYNVAEHLVNIWTGFSRTSTKHFSGTVLPFTRKKEIANSDSNQLTASQQT